MMRPTQPNVLWTEGLLLAPPHLQQSDRYHEALLGARLEAIAPIHWGIVRCELDRHALEGGVLRIAELAAVTAEGTVIVIDRDHPELPPSRNLDRAALDRGTVQVLLALPREREGTPVLGERARCAAHPRRIVDVCTEGGEAIEVELAMRNIQLVLGHEPREGLEVIAIAEIRRDTQGRVVLDESFVPPCLRVDASPVLRSSLAKLVARIRARRSSLLQARRARDAGTIEADASDVTRFVLLHALSSALPALAHFADRGDAAPRDLYLRLLDLLGSLSAFSVDASIEAPAFDHLDLRATFAPLFERLESLLETTHRESCFVVELEAREDGMHLGTLDDRVARCDRFLLAVRTDVGAKDAAGLVPSTAKVASWQQVTKVVQSALPGARLEVSHRPPPEVPVKAGEIYFTLEPSGPYWADIARERSVAVFLPRPFDVRHTRVSLLALPPRGAARDGHA